MEIDESIKKRVIDLAGTSNFRDLGGYHNRFGQVIKWRKIFRSDALHKLTAEDCQQLASLDIKYNCDLRTTREQGFFVDQTWDHVVHLDCHVYPEDRPVAKADAKYFREKYHLAAMDSSLAAVYQTVLFSQESRNSFAKVFAQLLQLDEQEALVFHCSAGKDRTGMMAALVLLALGIDDQTIVMDYLLSNNFLSFGQEWKQQTDDQLLQAVNRVSATKGADETILSFVNSLRAVWGTFDNFFTSQSGLGFEKADLDHLRKKFLEW
ncbi:MAG: tyrosine-protein phosphatase [Lactobacillus sp.]|jgi:protein-tyrosine phosphatase|nr:tyrosine-protein phosphatase [Lactobacillus sp.]MCH3905620.1 tyrosine-protein phosphatase [Lactobacillus sp.]MCI1466367.1 tyrosine-protein phosphatase [Lactobacillus sp.]MCI1481226.1 tyrosine-protein phosphatase [Lactobacillus sp.]MCI1884025.1 tyrosine-protein phosphatase [Lactobacillus sp.]